jgi:hypothetical protein
LADLEFVDPDPASAEWLAVYPGWGQDKGASAQQGKSMEDEAFGMREGQCQACDLWGPVNDLMLYVRSVMPRSSAT